MPTLTRFTGFEWPDLAAITATGSGLCAGVPGTAPSVLTTDYDPLGGGRCIQATPGVNGNYQLQMPTVGNVLVMSLRVRLITVPTSANDTVKMLTCMLGDNGGGTAGVSIGVDTSNGMWSVGTYGGTPNLFSSGVAATADGRWHTLDMRIVSSANPWVIDWALDGVLQAQQTFATTAGNLTPYVSCFNHGAQAATVRLDNWAQSSTSRDFPLGAIPIQGQAVSMQQPADHQGITLTDWQYTDNTFGSATDFASATETDSQSRIGDLEITRAIRVNAAAPAGFLRYPIQPLTTPLQPISVALVTASREEAAGTNNCTFRTNLNGNLVTHFTGDPGWGTTLNFLRSQMDTKPGGGAWTPADIASLDFEFASSDGAPAIWLGGLMYEVALTDDVLLPPLMPSIQR